MEQATLASGCFWCTEAVFQRLKGIESVVSGYSGGKREDPSYEQVSTGVTGHAEAIQVTFDPHIISFEHLLDIFFATHNPTTVNQQGADIGTQYRSVIFYHTDTQKRIAEAKIKEINESGRYPTPVVTQVVPFEAFYKAEEYHQNYYNHNKEAGYCQIIIDPKVRKLIHDFRKDVKEEYL